MVCSECEVSNKGASDSSITFLYTYSVRIYKRGPQYIKLLSRVAELMAYSSDGFVGLNDAIPSLSLVSVGCFNAE